MKLPRTLSSVFYFFRFVYFTLKERSARFLRYYPGHFSSPIPSYRVIQQKREKLFAIKRDLADGVNINTDVQLELLRDLYQYENEFRFPEKSGGDARYYLDNPMFGSSDAYVLYGFLRKFQPHRYIEVGSGHSSSLVLDYKDKWNSKLPDLTFIEPYPVRLNALLRDSDREHTKIIVSDVQDVEIEPFRQLQANDILFVDSSHLLRIDSDLSTIMFSILPILNSGVLIHFHDIFWPFENIESVIDDGRLWNESYVLRAFLQYNTQFRILYFQNYLKIFYAEEMADNVAAFSQGDGSSLWLLKD